MNVLFVADDQPDFLQDIVFHGLVSILGTDSVLDWPPVARYREQPPPDVTFPMVWFGLPPRPDVTEADAFAAADVFVIGSLRARNVDNVRRALAAAAGRPVAFLDGDDEPYIRGIAPSVDLYFKRETLVSDPLRVALMPLRRLRDRTRAGIRHQDQFVRRRHVATRRNPRIIPLPLGIIDVGFEPGDPPDTDVTFLASPTNVRRPELVKRLERLRAEGLRVRLPGDERIPWHEYLRALSRSRIAISAPGLGFDTYRYWEIPYSGALLLAETPRTVIPGNFEPGREAFFADADRLADAARSLLETDTAPVAVAGRVRLLREHTSEKRAETVLAHLESVLRRG